MKYRNQVIKALQDLSAWSEERLAVLDMGTFNSAKSAGYRSFIKKIDKDFDSLCQTLLVIASVIVEHRRVMLHHDHENYILGHFEASMKNMPVADGDDFDDLSRHNFSDDLPDQENLSFVLYGLFTWADDFLNSLNEVNTVSAFNSFMVNLDVEFDIFIKSFLNDLNLAIPLFSKPEESVRPSLLRIDEMMSSNGPETWMIEIAPPSLALRHEAPERLQ